MIQLIVVRKEDIREFCNEYKYGYSKYWDSKFLIYYLTINDLQTFKVFEIYEILKDTDKKEYYNGRNQRLLRRI